MLSSTIATGAMVICCGVLSRHNFGLYVGVTTVTIKLCSSTIGTPICSSSKSGRAVCIDSCLDEFEPPLEVQPIGLQCDPYARRQLSMIASTQCAVLLHR
ncbi:hypothetical protein QL285_094506 [Trifolium repens]|nr:hypothetical protein QL285_094506 [Trifolium repens]